MDLPQLADLLKDYSPAHFSDICASLKSLANELDNTKAALSSSLIAAQNRDDFSKAREILDMQEELSRRITDINSLLENYASPSDDNTGDDDPDNNSSASSAEPVDYEQYSMDDTVAYEITDTPVTFKRPAAFSFRGKRYAVTKWKTMYVQICGLLYKENPRILHSMINEEKRPGQRRIKMSLNRADLHSPARIEGSNIWVETNRSADDIRSFILTLLKRYQIPSDAVKVYFRRDYAALHADNEETDDQ